MQMHDPRKQPCLGDPAPEPAPLSNTTMSTAPPKVVLPTLDVLGVKTDLDTVDAKAIANEWLSNFAQAADVDALLKLFVEDGFWRDFLALTWDMRTFHGHARIKTFLEDRLAQSKISDVKLSTAPGEEPAIVKPYPDLAWLQLTFNFTTGAGIVSAIARLIPNAEDGVWRAYTLFTNLEGLKGHPPAIGHLRDTTHYPGTWSGMREKEREFKDTPDGPSVLIIGAGQSGLDVAARLKLKYVGEKAQSA
ncbi:hypothetical protein EXIGLDRAFT_830594 [Exidia glandulosa HHB12029]|uniref:FAD/NAD(P)-binding domain-containing protein n=1 Tax=Exidia glandulosa HHB12029 TaxID=1314781 RepID=A0A165NGB9_EXIGL|nr:hypothetical protein EXIGLDRAFT_830594 [Exidia glandulosa HHB12029]